MGFPELIFLFNCLFDLDCLVKLSYEIPRSFELHWHFPSRLWPLCEVVYVHIVWYFSEGFLAKILLCFCSPKLLPLGSTGFHLVVAWTVIIAWVVYRHVLSVN